MLYCVVYKQGIKEASWFARNHSQGTLRDRTNPLVPVHLYSFGSIALSTPSHSPAYEPHRHPSWPSECTIRTVSENGDSCGERYTLFLRTGLAHPRGVVNQVQSVISLPDSSFRPSARRQLEAADSTTLAHVRLDSRATYLSLIRGPVCCSNIFCRM